MTRRLHTVRSVLESDRIALLGIDLPPLGVALLGQQLRQLWVCDFSPGVLASSARLLAHYIYAGALLGSVAKLDRVPVTLKSHAKSSVPGGRRLAVLSHPRPQLARIGQDELTEFGTRLLVAAGQPALRLGHGDPRARLASAGVATIALADEPLVGHHQARRVRRRSVRRLRALPARVVRPPGGVPLVRSRTHR